LNFCIVLAKIKQRNVISSYKTKQIVELMVSFQTDQVYIFASNSNDIE